MPNLWIIYAIVSGLALVGYNTAFRMANHVPILTFLMIANGIGCIFYGATLVLFKEQIVMPETKTIILAAVVGLMIAATEITLFLMLQNTQNGMSIGISFINLVALLGTALVGWLVFKEQITWQNMLGVAFGLLSVWLLTYKSS